MARAGEVLVELAAGLVGRARRPKHPRPEEAREPVGLGVGIGVVVDLADAAVRDRHEQLSNWRIVQLVGDVEQALGGRGVAEAGVELRGNGHESSFLRSRRTPEDAACRAASLEEPSALPISS